MALAAVCLDFSFSRSSLIAPTVPNITLAVSCVWWWWWWWWWLCDICDAVDDVPLPPTPLPQPLLLVTSDFPIEHELLFDVIERDDIDDVDDDDNDTGDNDDDDVVAPVVDIAEFDSRSTFELLALAYAFVYGM